MLLRERGLEEYWTTPNLTTTIVEEYYEQERERQCATMPSVARYLGMKCSDRMSSDRAVMKGEVGMRGVLVVERYLDDVQGRQGSKVEGKVAA